MQKNNKSKTSRETKTNTMKPEYKIEILPQSNNPIYYQREVGVTHTPFRYELNLYNSIKDGNIDELNVAMSNYISYGFVIGHMSGDELLQTKYWAVATISLATHYAILGGMDETDAYNLSDSYLQTIDNFTSITECIEYLSSKAVELTQAVKASKPATTYSPKIRKCIHYIHIHLHQRLTISEIANEVNLSSSYLQTAFKKETGDTMHEYIMKERLAASINMLNEGMSYEQISYSLAFCSQTHYISSFKKQYGMTPGQYKKAFQISKS